MRMRPPGDASSGSGAFGARPAPAGSRAHLIGSSSLTVAADEVRVRRVCGGPGWAQSSEVVIVRVGRHGDVLAHQHVDALVVGVDLAERDVGFE